MGFLSRAKAVVTSLDERHHRLMLARDEHLMRHIDYLHAWMLNLDGALQEIRQLAAKGGKEAEERAGEVADDVHATALELAQQMKALKETFPTKLEDL